jgi:hypothetical protein
VRVEVVRFSTNNTIELRCFTEADASLLQPKLQSLGFDVTRDRTDAHTLFLHAPKLPQRGFTTADQLPVLRQGILEETKSE